MYRFFVGDEQLKSKHIIISGEDAHHIKNVLRLKPGEEISLSNGMDTKDYRCGILEYLDNEVVCELRFIKEDAWELSSEVYLFQGLPKGDKMELIIQKCVELGVRAIIPVQMKRCIMKLEDNKKEKKIARWQAISEAAAKQSKRGIIPSVSMPMSFKEAINYAKDMDVRLVPYEMEGELSESKGMKGTKEIIDNLRPNEKIAIFIGPEGGFDGSEIDEAVKAGFSPITLGKRILRTETAGITVMAWIMYSLEE